VSLHGFGALDVEGDFWRLEHPVKVEHSGFKVRIEEILPLGEDYLGEFGFFVSPTKPGYHERNQGVKAAVDGCGVIKWDDLATGDQGAGEDRTPSFGNAIFSGEDIKGMPTQGDDAVGLESLEVPFQDLD
jgi:hypothetical protein